MPYKELKSLYYKDKSKDKSLYRETYDRRITGDGTIVFDFDVHGNPAFVVLTPEILRLITNILVHARNVDEITKHELPDVALSQFIVKSLGEEIKQTLDIEHVHSTRKEIAEALENSESGKKYSRLQGMANKYKMLVRGEKIPLSTCQDVRALYDEFCLPEVLEENAGNAPDGKIFRNGPVNVMSKSDQVLHEGLFPESKIIEAMEKALHIVNNPQYNVLICIAVFHYMFAYIHPFYDGNGRMARFISSYLLSATYDRVIGFRLSYTIKARVGIYHKLFQTANDKLNKGDLTVFVTGFMMLLEESYDNLQTALQERVEHLAYYAELLEKILNDQRKMQVTFPILQATLFGDKGLSEPQIAESLEKNRSTVHSLLSDEEISPFLVLKKDGNRKLFTLNLQKIEEMAKE